MARITSAQIKKIYATSKELQLDNDLLHTFIFNMIGCEHISALTVYEANQIIDELEYKKTGVRKQQYRSNMATDDQIYKIHALERELGWNDNPRRLRGFMRKYCKTDNERWLTFDKASNLIEALKKVIDREKNKVSVQN
jgi:hypothetical protein